MGSQLEGRVAVITGGASGIGRATVLRFLAEGAAVVVGDLNADVAKDLSPRRASPSGSPSSAPTWPRSTTSRR